MTVNIGIFQLVINHNLKLSDRTYKCVKCGLTMDRDFNASVNLANYKSA